MKRALASATLLAALVGCEQDVSQPNLDYAPDMVGSVPYDSFAPNPNTPDGKTLLAPAPGTVPRGYPPFHYGPARAEASRAGEELKNPFPPSGPVLERGKVAFQRYCSHCHGHGGMGDGLVTTRFPTPPSLLAEHARGLPDGRIFHIITYGQGLMPAHGSQVAQEDRWKIVHYIRSLQNPPQTAEQTPQTAEKDAP